jgi:hypothetical protein
MPNRAFGSKLFGLAVIVALAFLLSSCTAVDSSTTVSSLSARKAGSKFATLTLGGTTLPGATTNTSYSYRLQAEGGAPPFRWTLAGGELPTGLLLDRVGNISGTPTKSGTFDFAATVTDGESPVAIATANFVVVVAGSSSQLAISTSSLPNGTSGTTYSARLQATGGTTPYTWSLVTGQLPVGLSLAADSGAITGTPTQAGSFSFTARVSDGGTVAPQKSFTISIASSEPVAAVSIATGSLPSGTSGTAYSASLQATGGQAPYGWSLASGALPAGVSLNPSTGVLSGTPSESGQSSFVAKVTDSNAASAQKSFSISIAAANTSPVAITTTDLADGVVDQSYAETLSASGGTQPYRWSLVSGALPAGVTLSSSGTLSGSPNASGSYTVGVKVTDAATIAQSTTKAFSLYVASAPSTGSGQPITKCGVLNTAGMTYVLQNDVSSAGTCFSIQASGITLDLNGKTVTYATSDSSTKRFGVLGIECYDPAATGNPCGAPFENFTLKNGKIVQGAAGAPFSDAIRFGSGSAKGLQINDVDITISGDSARALYTRYAKGGANIFRNTIHSNVRTIQSRHQLDGVAIKMEGDNTSGIAPVLVHDNTILGSAQGGIILSAPYSKIYNNNISLNSYYTNDFCVYAWSPNLEVYNNTCDNTQGTSMGRGIHIASGGARIHDNVIKVRELARNAEYNGCVVGGAYGIQFEGATTNNEVYRNSVTAIASECEAATLRVSNMPNTVSNVVRDNEFTAIRVGTSTKAAVGFSSAKALGGITIQRNVFTTDGWALYIPWDGASDVKWIDNQFAIGTNPDPTGWHLFKFQNASSSTALMMQDPNFTSGASWCSKGVTIGFNGWGGAEEYLLAWSTTIKVVNGSGAVVPGAAVSITDAKGSAVFSGTTDANGNVTVPLVQERRYNTTTSSVVMDQRTPHRVNVSAGGYTSTAVSVTADSKKSVSVTVR